MITAIIYLLLAGLVLYVIFYVVGLFVQGIPLKIIGAILALLFLLYALNMFSSTFSENKRSPSFLRPSSN